jgi:prophage regulatory protein
VSKNFLQQQIPAAPLTTPNQLVHRRADSRSTALLGQRPEAASAPTAAYFLGLEAERTDADSVIAASVRDILIRIDKVAAITGLSIPTIYREMSKNRFPRPLKITSAARAWKLSELSAWIDSRARQGD